jgi:hypothetical protein
MLEKTQTMFGFFLNIEIDSLEEEIKLVELLLKNLF